MPERYTILFRPEVEDDLRSIGKFHQNRALTAIENRLSSHPDRYGKPLGGMLAGLRRVRVGDFRIAYQVKGDQIVIWAIIHRKEVYAALAKRFWGGRLKALR